MVVCLTGKTRDHCTYFCDCCLIGVIFVQCLTGMRLLISHCSEFNVLKWRRFMSMCPVSAILMTLLYRCDHSLHLQVKSLTLLLRNLILKKGVRQPWRLSTQKYCSLLWWLLWGMYHSQATYASKLNILYYVFNYCSQDLDSIRIAIQTQWIVPR